jgi:hypothetical protein
MVELGVNPQTQQPLVMIIMVVERVVVHRHDHWNDHERTREIVGTMAVVLTETMIVAKL